MADSSLDHDQLRAECQRYLTSFRVLELKELLKNQGQSTKGRKPELFQRANDILQFGSPKFQTKIREIYERSNNFRRQLSYNRTAQKTSPEKSRESVVKKASRPYIVHPDVKFKSHPFFSKLETIIRPTALMSSGLSSSHGSLNMKLKFHLTPQQIHQIYVSKTSTGTYQTQILARFCLQETTCEQNDYYPKQCFLKVNGHTCPIPGYHPHLSTRPDYKRNGQPVNITNFVKTSPADINEVIIYWAHDIMLPQGYCVGIEIAKVVSSSDLLQALKAKGLRSSDMSRALVKEKFAVGDDSEVAATSIKVSLLCPIGKMRMTYPCRTTQCNHLQCFDASIFYQMNEKRARWVCPVCDKPALPGDLFIDGLFMEICQKNPPASNIIEFSADGSWQPASETSSASLNVCTPDRRGNSPITVDTPDVKKSDMVVIDLTASSDEEDEREEDEGSGGRKGVDEEELEEEEVREGNEEGNRDQQIRYLPPHSAQRLQAVCDDGNASDSESTISSTSSSTIAAPNSPPLLPHRDTFPCVSIPLSGSQAPLSTSTISPRPYSSQSQPPQFPVILPTTSVHLSSDSQSTPTSSRIMSTPSSSASQPTSVIMQTRPSHSHSRSHTQSRTHHHTRPHFHSHPRIRKRSHSSTHSHQHTQSSSHLLSRSAGSSSRSEGASVPSRGTEHSFLYLPFSNGYPSSGEAPLLSSNIMTLVCLVVRKREKEERRAGEVSFGESLFRSNLYLPMSSTQSHVDSDD